MAAGTDATPVLLPIERQIEAKGDKSATLRSVPVAATNVDGWTSDYAMMRLSQVAGRPIWAMTEDGQPGPVISTQIPATSRSEEHTSELQSLMRISYAVFCLKKKTNKNHHIL